MQTLIFMGGQVSPSPLSERLIASVLAVEHRILAVDQGADLCRELAIRPDLMLGDMDSVQKETLRYLADAGVPMDRFPTRKNATDGELALQAAVDEPTDKITILAGISAVRPDHAQMNLEMLKHLKAKGISCELSDGQTLITLIEGPEEMEFSFTNEFPPCPILSLIPLSPCVKGIRYHGLAYDLQDAVMEAGSSRGLSNYPAAFDENPSAESWSASIRVAEGSALIYITPGDAF